MYTSSHVDGEHVASTYTITLLMVSRAQSFRFFRDLGRPDLARPTQRTAGESST